MRLSYKDLLAVRDRLMLIEDIQSEYYLIEHGTVVVLAEGRHDMSMSGVIKYITRLDSNIQRIKSGDHSVTVARRLGETVDCSDIKDILDRAYT